MAEKTEKEESSSDSGRLDIPAPLCPLVNGIKRYRTMRVSPVFYAKRKQLLLIRQLLGPCHRLQRAEVECAQSNRLLAVRLLSQAMRW